MVVKVDLTFLESVCYDHNAILVAAMVAVFGNFYYCFNSSLYR